MAKLIAALDTTPNAIVQIGSVLLLKIDGEVIVCNLTQLELLHLERNPEILRAPNEALRELQRMNTAESQHSSAMRAVPKQ